MKTLALLLVLLAVPTLSRADDDTPSDNPEFLDANYFYFEAQPSHELSITLIAAPTCGSFDIQKFESERDGARVVNAYVRCTQIWGGQTVSSLTFPTDMRLSKF